MRHLALSLLLLIILSVLFFSCDPDKPEKKPNTTNTQNKDNKNKKPATKELTKLTKATPIPVASLGAISTTASKDASKTAWVSQGAKITFSTKAKDAKGREIPNAQFKWEWRKRGKKTTTKFGHTWEKIDGQTDATATLSIDAAQRVGAYELRVSATSGSQEKSKDGYKFIVRKYGCPAPSATNQPADIGELRPMVVGGKALTDAEIRALDTSQVESLGNLFRRQNFNKDISCWDISRVTNMTSVFASNSAFDQDIGDWDTSKVSHMTSAFERASAFNKDISGWDTSEVQFVAFMFWNASAFNQDLSGWNVDKVTNKSRFALGANASWTKDRQPDF